MGGQASIASSVSANEVPILMRLPTFRQKVSYGRVRSVTLLPVTVAGRSLDGFLRYGHGTMHRAASSESRVAQGDVSRSWQSKFLPSHRVGIRSIRTQGLTRRP